MAPPKTIEGLIKLLQAAKAGDKQAFSGEAVLSQIAAEELLQVVSTEERAVLSLRLVEGFSSRDVALKVNKSEMAVRQIQCRALKKIRDYYTSSSAYPRAG